MGRRLRISNRRINDRVLNSEFGMRNAERKKRTEVFEFGIGNAEFGKKKEDRGQNAEVGMWNAERKKKDFGFEGKA